MGIPLNELTEEQKLEDFEFLYNTLYENYPLFEVQNRKYGIDWLANKDGYISLVKRTKNLESTLRMILNDLNDSHTSLFDKGFVEFARVTYKRLKENGYWQGILFDILNDPLVLSRYSIRDNNTISDEKVGDTEQQKYANATVSDIVEGKIASISIHSMISYYTMDKDKKLIREYLQKVKDYQALVIDIRGNGGGDSRYWSKFLLPQILAEEAKSTNYIFYRGGEVIKDFYKAKNTKTKSIDKLDLSTLKNLPVDIIEEFEYYEQLNTIVSPSKDSIKFEGNIYLLVDDAVYSSAEALATFVKNTNFATIIGEQTKGAGIGTDPFIAMLPNSGLVFRFTGGIGTTFDGTSTEEHPTMPDYVVKPAYSAKDDECIKKVLELEGIKDDG